MQELRYHTREIERIAFEKNPTNHDDNQAGSVYIAVCSHETTKRTNLTYLARSCVARKTQPTSSASLDRVTAAHVVTSQ